MRHGRGLLFVCLSLTFGTNALLAQVQEDRAVHAPPATSAAIPVPLPDAAPDAVMPSERPLVPESLPPISANGVNGLSLVGLISYAYTANATTGTAQLHADRVENASTTRTSGTLRLTLWLSTAGYRQTGYRTAIYTLGQLPPNSYYAPVDSGNLTFTTPPTGCYYVSMLLEEFQSGGTYAYVDYLDYNNLASINGGCPSGPPSCTYTLSSSTGNVAATGGSGTVNVVSGPSGCAGTWGSTPNASWLSVASGGSGSGAGTTTLTYSAASNSSTSSRSGTLTVAGSTFTVTQPGITTTPACTANATTLCLVNNRFKVTSTWKTSGGQTGVGQAVPITSDTGYFWFFGSTNVEMVVKVIAGCPLSNTYWVFAGGLTDVNVVLSVTDTKSGVVRTYTNPLGIAFQPIQDTSAFATCP